MGGSASTLLITVKRRVWRITLDGAFYGDYRSHRHAARSADAAATTLRNDGHKVEIVVTAAAKS